MVGTIQKPPLTTLFDAARPYILGALLDAASHGLQRLPSIQLKRLPRMADFALWATACETVLWPAGTFTRAYDENRRAAIEGVIEADLVIGQVLSSCEHLVDADRSPEIRRASRIHHRNSIMK